MIANIDEVIDICLNRMKSLVEAENYVACSSLANDLTTVTLRFDYESGVFLSVVLDDAFGQVDNTLRMRTVGVDYQNKVRDQLSHYLDDVMRSHRKNNKNDLFIALMKIQSTATRLYYYGFELPRSIEGKVLEGADG